MVTYINRVKDQVVGIFGFGLTNNFSNLQTTYLICCYMRQRASRNIILPHYRCHICMICKLTRKYRVSQKVLPLKSSFCGNLTELSYQAYHALNFEQNLDFKGATFWRRPCRLQFSFPDYDYSLVET